MHKGLTDKLKKRTLSAIDGRPSIDGTEDSMRCTIIDSPGELMRVLTRPFLCLWMNVL